MPVNSLGLSLSGGGYRAAAFHLGTLRKLKKLGILDKIKVLSTISGGSIAGACYALEKDDFERFDRRLYESVSTQNVIRRALLSRSGLQTAVFFLVFLVAGVWLLFTHYAWMSAIILLAFFVLLIKFQFKIFPVSTEIEKAYDSFFYGGKTLKDLPISPKLVVGSTNLQTARPFIFAQDRMGDSTYFFLKPAVLFHHESFPIARAVMASSCVPFAFTPIRIGKEYFVNPNDMDRADPQLVDGGVFDNQGIHKVVQEGEYECSTVITSDAGNKLSYQGNYNNLISLLVRCMDVFMSRIKSVQMIQDIYDNTNTANRQIAYISLGWDFDKCISGFVDNMIKKQVAPSVISAQGFDPQWIVDPAANRQFITDHLVLRTGLVGIDAPTPSELECARNVGTNLTPLSIAQMDSLIKQAEAITELQVKLYCPSLIS